MMPGVFRRCEGLHSHKTTAMHGNECTPPPWLKKVRLTSGFSRMELTLHATRRTPHGASRLVLAMSAWSVKTRHMLRPGIVGMRGSIVIRLRPWMKKTIGFTCLVAPQAPLSLAIIPTPTSRKTESKYVIINRRLRFCLWTDRLH